MPVEQSPNSLFDRNGEIDSSFTSPSQVACFLRDNIKNWELGIKKYKTICSWFNNKLPDDPDLKFIEYKNLNVKLEHLLSLMAPASSPKLITESTKFENKNLSTITFTVQGHGFIQIVPENQKHVRVRPKNMILNGFSTNNTGKFSIVYPKKRQPLSIDFDIGISGIVKIPISNRKTEANITQPKRALLKTFQTSLSEMFQKFMVFTKQSFFLILLFLANFMFFFIVPEYALYFVRIESFTNFVIGNLAVVLNFSVYYFLLRKKEYKVIRWLSLFYILLLFILYLTLPDIYKGKLASFGIAFFQLIREISLFGNFFLSNKYVGYLTFTGVVFLLYEFFFLFAKGNISWGIRFILIILLPLLVVYRLPLSHGKPLYIENQKNLADTFIVNQASIQANFVSAEKNIKVQLEKPEDSILVYNSHRLLNDIANKRDYHTKFECQFEETEKSKDPFSYGLIIGIDSLRFASFSLSNDNVVKICSNSLFSEKYYESHDTIKTIDTNSKTFLISFGKDKASFSLYAENGDLIFSKENIDFQIRDNFQIGQIFIGKQQCTISRRKWMLYNSTFFSL